MRARLSLAGGRIFAAAALDRAGLRGRIYCRRLGVGGLRSAARRAGAPWLRPVHRAALGAWLDLDRPAGEPDGVDGGGLRMVGDRGALAHARPGAAPGGADAAV